MALSLKNGAASHARSWSNPAIRKSVSNLIACPANFFYPFAPPSPAAALADKPINVAPGFVGFGAVAAAHHHHSTGFFKANGARPVFPEADWGIDAEEEVALPAEARGQRIWPLCQDPACAKCD